MKRVIKKPDVRRQEIVRTAKALFLERDYDKTTMQDLITTLGIAKGTIYHYFKSKEDLLEAVIQDMVEDYLVDVQATVANAKGNALDRMKALIAAGQLTGTQTDTLDQLHRLGNSVLHTRLLAVTISKLAVLYAEVIEQGIKEGLFQVEHPLETAEFIIAGIQFITDKGCFPWQQNDLARRGRSIPSLLEAQLKAPQGSFNFLTFNF